MQVPWLPSGGEGARQILIEKARARGSGACGFDNNRQKTAQTGKNSQNNRDIFEDLYRILVYH